MPLGPQSARIRFLYVKDFEGQGKVLSQSGDGAVFFLSVAAHIDAKHLAGIDAAYKTAHTAGKALRIYPARPRSSPFRKNEQILILVQKVSAFFQDLFHLFSFATPINGYAFCQIAKEGGEDVPLEIGALRQVPGQQMELHHVAMHGGNGICQDHGINIG